MEDLLRRQSEQLAQVVKLLTINRNLEIAQTLESHKMLSDEDHIAKKLDEIHETVKNIEAGSIKRNLVNVSKDLDIKKLSEENSNSHLEALKKIQETLVKNNEYRSIANRAKDQPINKSWSDNLRDLKDTISGIKKALTSGTVLKSTGQAIASSVSPRYKDRMQYIKSEKALGNKASDKELKESYEKRSQLLQRNVANERFMEKTKGYLSEPEFIKGDTEQSKQYIKEKQDVGAGLKETDSRYTLNEKVAKKEAIEREKLASEFKPDIAVPVKEDSIISQDTSITKAKAAVANPIKENVKDLSKAVAEKAKAIPQMINTNLSTKEFDIESARATKTYQDTQIENDIKQTDILNEQLDTQKSILEKIDEISKNPPSTPSTGTGIGGPLESIVDAATGTPKGKGAGKGKIGKFAGKAGAFLKGGIATAAGMAIEAGGEAISEGGNRDVGDVVSTAGSAAQGAGTGAMLGSALGPVGTAIGATAGGIIGAAEGFSDSFGEGGFELIQKLRKEDALSYGLGTTPTVDKWDVIEKLPPEKIQTLINTNEFEGKDLQHLEKLLEQPKAEAISPEATKAEAVTPEATKAEAISPEIIKPISTEPAKVVTKEGVSINQEGWDNKSSDLVEPIRQRAEPISQTDDKKTEFKQALKTETDRIFAENLKKEPEEWQNDVDVRNEVRSEAELQAKVNLKERGINPYDLINDKGEVQRVGAKQQESVKSHLSDSLKNSPTPFEAVTPEATRAEAVTPSKINTVIPSEAETVYNKSAELSPTGNVTPIINNITAPTTNVNNSPNTTVMKNEVKNSETSVNRLFSNRQTFY